MFIVCLVILCREMAHPCPSGSRLKKKVLSNLEPEGQVFSKIMCVFLDILMIVMNWKWWLWVRHPHQIHHLKVCPCLYQTILTIKFTTQMFRHFRLGFSRYGTSRCPFVSGQKNLLVSLSLCPGTRAVAKIPGQTSLSWDVPGQNHYLIGKKDVKKSQKLSFFSAVNCNICTLFSLLTRGCPRIIRDETGCLVPACSMAKYQNAVYSKVSLLRSVARFLACPILPLSRDKEGTSVSSLLSPGTMKRLLSLCPAGQENPVPLESLLYTPLLIKFTGNLYD